MNMLSRNSILFIVKRVAYWNFLFDWRGTYRPTIEWRGTDYRQTNHWLQGYRLQTDQPFIGGIQTTDRPTIDWRGTDYRQTNQTDYRLTNHWLEGYRLQTDQPNRLQTDQPNRLQTDQPNRLQTDQPKVLNYLLMVHTSLFSQVASFQSIEKNPHNMISGM